MSSLTVCTGPIERLQKRERVCMWLGGCIEEKIKRVNDGETDTNGNRKEERKGMGDDEGGDN